MEAIINANAVLMDRILPNTTILTENGVICAVGQNLTVPAAAKVTDAAGLLVGPGFVDIHVHGDGSAARWRNDPEQVARHHLCHGTTTIVATMSYTQTRQSLLEKTEMLQAKLEAGLLPNLFAVGFEGPYINPARGAKSAQFARSGPDREEYTALYKACHGRVAQWAYAPEMDTDGAFGDFLKNNGIPAAVGHTNASPAQIRAAVDKGATIATHLYDAMGCWMGDDSWQITGTAQETAAVGCLLCPELIYELIPDSKGVHVKPANLQLVYRFAGADRIAIITDCTVCDYDPADYPADHFRSTPDLNYNELGQLSGSRLTMDRAVRNFKTHTGATIPELFRMASATPAKAIGAFDKIGSLAPGKYANMVFLDGQLQLQKVIFRGKEVTE